MGKNVKGRSVREVQVAGDDGEVTDFTSEGEVHTAIWNEVHRKRFHLAEEAPICRGQL